MTAGSSLTAQWSCSCSTVTWWAKSGFPTPSSGIPANQTPTGSPPPTASWGCGATGGSCTHWGRTVCWPCWVAIFFFLCWTINSLNIFVVCAALVCVSVFLSCSSLLGDPSLSKHDQMVVVFFCLCWCNYRTWSTFTMFSHTWEGKKTMLRLAFSLSQFCFCQVDY